MGTCPIVLTALIEEYSSAQGFLYCNVTDSVRETNSPNLALNSLTVFGGQIWAVFFSLLVLSVYRTILLSRSLVPDLDIFFS